MILSTLAELEENSEVVESEDAVPKPLVEQTEEKSTQSNNEEIIKEEEPQSESSIQDEKLFCQSMRERILVLFEGFQSPNNKSIEAKVDLTLNFLEYSLAVLDERLEKLNKK